MLIITKNCVQRYGNQCRRQEGHDSQNTKNVNFFMMSPYVYSFFSYYVPLGSKRNPDSKRNSAFGIGGNLKHSIDTSWIKEKVLSNDNLIMQNNY